MRRASERAGGAGGAAGEVVEWCERGVLASLPRLVAPLDFAIFWPRTLAYADISEQHQDPPRSLFTLRQQAMCAVHRNCACLA
jgi:hypothetical protein